MIVVLKEMQHGKAVFSKSEIEALLEQARLEGYNEGYKDAMRSKSSVPVWATADPIPVTFKAVSTGECKRGWTGNDL